MTELYLAGNLDGKGKSAINSLISSDRVVPPYMLDSYYYCREDTSFGPVGFKHRDEYDGFLLDSGAYTFMDNISRDPEEIDFQEYTDQYAQFINKHDIDLFFELDIDNVVGLARTRELRRRLETKTGKGCIPVWHKSRGKDAFLKIAREYDHIAIGGIVADEFSQDEYKYFRWFVDKAHDLGAKIHGLGFTPSNIGEYGFDSVDSTSWLSGGRFGTVHRFTGHGLEQESREARAKYPANIIHNFKEWVKYAHYLDSP